MTTRCRSVTSISQHRELEPRRRASRRCPHARTARAVPPPVWARVAVDRPGREASPGIRPRRLSCRCTDGEHSRARRGCRSDGRSISRRAAEWHRALAVGIGAFAVSRVIVVFGAYTRAAQVVTDRQAGATRSHRHAAADDRGDLHAVGRQVVPDDRRERLSAKLPERITYITGNGATGLLSRCTLIWRSGSTSSPRAASSRRCSASTWCCRSPPSCSSACSPATCTGRPSPSDRWCRSPFSPVPSCCRGRTPRRRSSSAPRRVCCSCNVNSGCSQASLPRSVRRRGRTASPSSRRAWSRRRSPSTSDASGAR